MAFSRGGEMRTGALMKWDEGTPVLGSRAVRP